MKETARRFKEGEKVEVTATQMDRDLAARYDSIKSSTTKLFTTLRGWPVAI